MLAMVTAVFESGRHSVNTGFGRGRGRGRGPNSALLEVRMLLAFEEAVVVLVRDVV